VPAPALDPRTLVRAAAAIATLLAVAGAAVLWALHQDQAGRGQTISFEVPALTASPTQIQPATRLPPPFAVRLAEQAAQTDQREPAGPASTAPPAAASDASPAADAATVPKGPTQEQIRAAIRRISVAVYTTRTSPVCSSARAFLAANQILFAEKDIESNAGYGAELAALNPSRTVPTFVVDGQIVVGFDPARLARFIGGRVEQQLGVKLDVRVPDGPR
jgi:glutaredoxin